MYYINHKHETFGTETIDEAETKKEAKRSFQKLISLGATSSLAFVVHNFRGKARSRHVPR